MRELFVELITPHPALKPFRGGRLRSGLPTRKNCQTRPTALVTVTASGLIGVSSARQEVVRTAATDLLAWVGEFDLESLDGFKKSVRSVPSFSAAEEELKRRMQEYRDSGPGA